MKIDEIAAGEIECVEPGILDDIGNPVPVTLAATVVYVPLLVVSLVLAVFWQETVPGSGSAPAHLLADAAIGCGVALVILLLDWMLMRLIPAFRQLGTEFRKMLGPLRPSQVVYLALLSGLAEELCFRGVIQPWIGYVPASILFGLLHIVPSRAYLPVTAFAMAVGFVCGGLLEWRGSLMAPIVVHTLVNGVNIHLIVSGPPWRSPGHQG